MNRNYVKIDSTCDSEGWLYVDKKKIHIPAHEEIVVKF